jgi:cation diffusion facilitator family transporter
VRQLYHTNANNMTTPQPGAGSPTRFAWLSIAAALTTITLKSIAYLLTGSVGLLSDTLESFVNLAGAVIALAMLTVASRPADEDHTFGHSKAEYFSSGAEGVLILIAAASIAAAAIPRILAPQPLEQVWIGLAVSVAASLVNLVVSRSLLRASKRFRSITLEADAHHLMTDVWTSGGVLVGVTAVVLTGWNILDPIIALIVAANIVWTGVKIVRTSVSGLMDTAIVPEDQAALHGVMESFVPRGVECSGLRTRQSGAEQFISFKVRMPGSWTVRQGHDLVAEIERDLLRVLPNATVIIHMEPGS